MSREVLNLQAENLALRKALEPLAKIWDAFKANSLDEARPDWGDEDGIDKELYSGRGGKQLLTLQMARFAHEILHGDKPSLDFVVISSALKRVNRETQYGPLLTDGAIVMVRHAIEALKDGE